MKKTIAVIGGSRRHGNTGRLVDKIAQELGAEVIDIANLNISTYDYEHKNLNDDFIPTIKYILSHDNIIFASPVYWYAMSAEMKTFFDRISDVLAVEELKDLGRKFRGKTAYLVATSVHKELDNTFIEGFTKTFNYLGLNYGGHIHALCDQGLNFETHAADVASFTNNVRSNSIEIKASRS